MRNPLIKQKGLINNAQELLNTLTESPDSSHCVIFGKRKFSQKKSGHVSTRSRYIGVTLNGTSWQALISIEKRKTYIGTYQEERLAALAFDFYSILLNKFNAMTNFNYTKRDILDMLNHFNSNDQMFDAVSYYGRMSSDAKRELE